MSASTFKWSAQSEFTQWDLAVAAASSAEAAAAVDAAADSNSFCGEVASDWVADAKAVGWAAVPW